MLNKKAQVEDNIEFVLCILGLIIGVVVLTLLKADYAWSIDHAKNAWRAGTEIPPFDTQFMGTDLLNTAKMNLPSTNPHQELLLLLELSLKIKNHFFFCLIV